jgi:hypothetical protein
MLTGWQHRGSMAVIMVCGALMVGRSAPLAAAGENRVSRGGDIRTTAAMDDGHLAALPGTGTCPRRDGTEVSFAGVAPQSRSCG